MRRFERAEQKSSEYWVGDDHAGKSNVWEEERNNSLAAADDRLTPLSTDLATCYLASRSRRRRPVERSTSTCLSWLYPTTITPLTGQPACMGKRQDISSKAWPWNLYENLAYETCAVSCVKFWYKFYRVIFCYFPLLIILYLVAVCYLFYLFITLRWIKLYIFLNGIELRSVGCRKPVHKQSICTRNHASLCQTCKFSVHVDLHKLLTHVSE